MMMMSLSSLLFCFLTPRWTWDTDQ